MLKEVIFHDLGLISFTEAWDFQRQLSSELIEQKRTGLDTKNHLIFCEHSPVYTLGKSGNNANLLLSEAEIEKKGAKLLRIDRGGDITFHGPGQLVGYFIFNLEQLGIGVKQFVFNIEEGIIRFLKRYNIEGKRLHGATGVWLDTETNQSRKICAIGIKVSRSVTMHGFALNITTNLDYFNSINPCGFVDKSVTSLEKETTIDFTMDNVKEELYTDLKGVFNLTLTK